MIDRALKSYALRDGDRLVLSVDGGAWETVTFVADRFAEIGAATADEIAAVLAQVSGLETAVDDDGALRLSTVARGGHAALEIDLAASSAAPALGLGAGGARSDGRGPSAARLVGREREPFDLADGAGMTVTVDGKRRRIVFEGAGRRSAAEVAERIAAKHPDVARATRDGRVALTSRRVGPAAHLEVRPHPDLDAASTLGFVGPSAAHRPKIGRPAELACPGHDAGLELVNLSTGPLELPFATGAMTLPPGGALPLAHARGAAEHVERLLGRRLLGLRPASKRSPASRVASPNPPTKE